MLSKVYIRHREGIPDGVNFFAAYDGFRNLGVEIAAFEGFGDLETLTDLGPEVGVCGYIGDVHEALRRMGKVLQEPLDYPKSLAPYLYREIRLSTMGDVRRSTAPCFVKPVAHKSFTGLVYQQSDAAARRAVVTVSSDTPVWVCDQVLPAMSEYRVFVLNGEIVGVKHYKGDWSCAPDRSVVEAAVKAYVDAPAAYALDFGAYLSDSHDQWTPDYLNTVLIEANDSFALGCYGLSSTAYATMIAARWEELTR